MSGSLHWSNNERHRALELLIADQMNRNVAYELIVSHSVSHRFW